MTQQAELEQTLRNVLHELGPYLPNVVLIGGWVPGYLTDLYELLAEAADRYAPLPPGGFEEVD